MGEKRRQIANMMIIFMVLFYPAIQGPIWFVVTMPFRAIGLTISVELLTGIIWSIIILYNYTNGYFRIIKKKAVVLYLLCIFISVLSKTFFKYDYFTDSILMSMMFSLFPLVICGSLININEKDEDRIYYLSLITFLVSLLYQLYYLSTGRILLIDNMDNAYKILPVVLILFGSPFMKNKISKLKIGISIGAIVFLMVQGTRGPILCLGIFIILLVIKKYGVARSSVISVIVIIFAIIMFSSSNFQKSLTSIISKIDSTGASSRVLVMLTTGKIADGNGRDELQDLLLDDIKEDPLIIRGLYSDRQATKGFYNPNYSVKIEEGTYAHSIWLELFYDFGVLIGGIILILLILKCYNLWHYSNGIDNLIGTVFIICGFVRLFISGSYLTTGDFYFLVGIFVKSQSAKYRNYNYRINSQLRGSYESS